MRRNRKSRGGGGRRKGVYCSKHNGYGPGPIRNWNGHRVCGNCYKTLTKFRFVGGNKQASKPKGFFAKMFGL